jgi:phosphocarrier protein
MMSQTFTIVNRKGLHARPATKMVVKAREFSSVMTLEKDGTEVNAKSLLELMTLSAEKGSQVTVSAEGADAREAIEAIGQLIAAKFGEDE